MRIQLFFKLLSTIPKLALESVAVLAATREAAWASATEAVRVALKAQVWGEARAMAWAMKSAGG